MQRSQDVILDLFGQFSLSDSYLMETFEKVLSKSVIFRNSVNLSKIVLLIKQVSFRF